jgi:apolipoprotein D and lipocalin family protein
MPTPRFITAFASVATVAATTATSVTLAVNVAVTLATPVTVALAVGAAWPAAAAAQQRLLTVPEVDLQRYAGIWYEVARLPNRFQDQCIGDVTATYAPRADGQVDVTNRCRTAAGDDTWAVAEGRARPVDDTGARLKVSFLPSWIRWLPFGWSDYWVLELDPEYRHALVGEPSRRYLWVLSRSPGMPAEQLQDILGRAQEMGFPIGDVTVTPHR